MTSTIALIRIRSLGTSNRYVSISHQYRIFFPTTNQRTIFTFPSRSPTHRVRRRDGLSRQNIREYTFDASVTRHGIYTACVESAPRRARVLPRAKTKASSGASKRRGSTVTRSLRSLWLVLLAPMIYRTVVLTYKTVIIFYHPAGSTETSAMHDRRPYLA